MPALGFGTLIPDAAATISATRDALEAGFRRFDCAERYRNEREVGSALQAGLAAGGIVREDIFVTTKLWNTNHRPERVGPALEASLERLGLDYLDLYFCHRPDPDTPIEETVAAMDTLIRQGKVLYWGTSEWPAEAIHDAHRIAKQNHLYAPVMEQPEYNLLHRERVEVEYAPLYAAYGMGTTIWSPLASGLLSGKYNDGVPPDSRLTQPGYEWLRESVLGHGNERIDKVRALQPIADEIGVSLAQLAIAWCLLNEHVSTVMLGASRREQLEHNLDALELLPRLDAGIAQRIRQVVEAA